jgi:hypothetical protein
VILNLLGAWYSFSTGLVWFDRDNLSHAAYSLATWGKGEYQMMEEGWVKVAVCNGEVDITMLQNINARRIVGQLVDQGIIYWDSEVVISRGVNHQQKTAIYV